MSGTLDDLSPAQAQALAQIKTLIPADVTPEDDHELLRFLRARKFDVEAAKAMFLNYKSWYITKRIGEVTDCDPPKADYFRRTVPFSYHGFDKLGRPLYIEKTGRVSPDFVLNYFSDEEILAAHIWSMEISVKRFAEGRRRAGGRHVEKFANIMDLEGITMGHRHAMHIVKLFSACDAAYYPERMGFLMIVNAPAIFPMLWSVAKTFIDPVTASKIHVLGSDYKQKLLELVDADQLPVEYGGTCSLNCAVRKSGATAQCCVPTMTEAELWAYAMVDESKFQTPTKVKNGKTFVVEFAAAADHQHVWHFRTEKHDIEFSAEFVPAAAPSTPVVITAKRKVERHDAGFQGVYISKEAGTVRLVWDNTASMFTSKIVAFSHESKPFVPDSRFAEEVLAPIREYNALEIRRKSLDAAAVAADAALNKLNIADGDDEKE